VFEFKPLERNMSVLEKLIVENGGKVTLPIEVQDRYGMVENTAIRIIETQKGVLLIPLTDEPMNAELAAEINEWQSIGVESWDMFPYEEQKP
jgi:bifunctional DNA-binding transcriptional regulator/antitoxin component of YhaV-PrlF toxin-antitoxin module